MSSAPTNEARVCVLVINWNGREHLGDCFDSLLLSTCQHAEFILVDNGSDDDSIALVEEKFGHDPRVLTLPCAENLGWSGGNNVGIRHALKEGADYIFLLNNDTAVSPDCIAHLVATMEAHPECGALAPRMVLFDQPCLINSVGLEMSIIGSAWDRGIGRADTSEWHKPVPVIGVCGGACFLRASVLEQTGLLPEEFEIYLDDLDLCLRIWNVGFSIWSCPEAIVRHKFSATMGEGTRARRKYFLNTRNRFWLLLRHYPASRLLATLPALMLGELRAMGRSIVTGDYWRMGAHLRAWVSALIYLPKARRFHHQHTAITSGATFWPLIRKAPLFCPDVTLPVKGWYPPVQVAGETLRPMAPEATLMVPAGPLRLCLTNCYPERGPAQVSFTLDGEELGSLQSMGREEAVFDVSGGLLTLRAASLFLPSTTGSTMDIGAWIQIYHSGNPLV